MLYQEKTLMKQLRLPHGYDLACEASNWSHMFKFVKLELTCGCLLQEQVHKHDPL